MKIGFPRLRSIHSIEKSTTDIGLLSTNWRYQFHQSIRINYQCFRMIVNTELARSVGHLNKDLWETPGPLFWSLDAEFDFTLDPCCTIETAKCQKFYTPEIDGLAQSWESERVFCNPPYSRGNIDTWVKKMYDEQMNAELIVGLLPVSTSATWFHDFVYHKSEIRFIKGRIRFVGAPFTAPFSSMIVIWR